MEKTNAANRPTARKSSKTLKDLEREAFPVANSTTPDGATGAATIYLSAENSECGEAKAANVATSGFLPATQTVMDYSGNMFAEQLKPAAVAQALKDRAAAVHGGDLTYPESMLVAQAVALDAIFHRLAHRAAMNIGNNLEGVERNLRLALRAQAQAARTLEVLGGIKNPSFIGRQTNIANGGPQQVNNGPPPVGATAPGGPASHAAAPQAEGNNAIELSTGARNGQRLDA